ncbi:MAG: family efflux transporter subunit [Devosia sp.]|uniref:efflux RND transporter periplasmic adaptor subunit n=1 Tax=Devosia sp. TaxID=1871048 RepID=UPI0026247E78|nr:efflux RND transporter periplasmic adaptor subunit [Devosia sp.]MDB5541382.1 family efflux transporter subunit [Devosia sp.]
MRLRLRTVGVVVVGVAALGLAYVERVPLSQLTGLSWFSASPAAAAAGGAAGAATPAAGRPGAQAPGRTVVTAVAVAGTLPVTRQTVGWILSPASVSLTTTVAGTVSQLVGVQGAEVKKGDLIATLDPRIAQAAVERDKAQILLDQASKNQADVYAVRMKKLADEGSGTVQTYDDAEAAAKIADATLVVGQATLASDQVLLDNTQIRAPFDGRLGAFQVAVGALVQPATPIVTLTQMNPLLATFSLPQGDLQPLQTAIRNNTESINAVSTTSTTAAVTGKIDFVDSTIDVASGTFNARATLANDALVLWPGESVSITVGLGPTGPLVLVPNQAVQASGSGFLVYVVTPAKTIDVRTVTPGLSVGQQTGITAGLQAGEHVVTEGQIRLTQGMRVAESPAPPTPVPVATAAMGTPGTPATGTSAMGTPAPSAPAPSPVPAAGVPASPAAGAPATGAPATASPAIPATSAAPAAAAPALPTPAPPATGTPAPAASAP